MSHEKNLSIFHLILFVSCFQITFTNSTTWITMDVNESPDGVGPVAVLIRKDKERDREYINSLLTTESAGASSSSSLSSSSQSLIDANSDELLTINTTDASPSLFYVPILSENGTNLTPLTSNSNKSVVVTVNTSLTANNVYRGNISSNNNNTSNPLLSQYLTSLNDTNIQGPKTLPRWVDFRNRPAPPPRQPPIHGIPSGFRNPLSTSTYPSPPIIPQAPLIHTPSFGGSSTNPVGFAGSVPSSISSSFLNGNGMARKPYINLTRVEHISAECSDDYMKVVTAFNGTFNGLVYSAGYVHDPNCIYVNGTGRNRYEFFIRLNQCGTLGRQEMYLPKRPGEVRRRDNLMWNTLSIQFNPLIEEEWDEHYRVTCEYGSDFWKTVTFPSINVESFGSLASDRVNTGSPVVFTINPPQCQMEIRRGFGVAGTRTSGPVTVGDPLTLLIHMKSEKPGFDILVKNCIAHNGGAQRLQLIDTNGCVTNEKLISPFRGTYNTDDGSQVTLYAFLKAFRFTGSPALYLECDIHMCHNKCPPQRCYWRNLSKRDLSSVMERNSSDAKESVISESISLFQALEVRHDGDTDSEDPREARYRAEIDLESGICMPVNRVALFICIFCLFMLSTISITVCTLLKLRRLRKNQRCVNDRFPYKSSSSSPSPTFRSLSPRY